MFRKSLWFVPPQHYLWIQRVHDRLRVQHHALVVRRVLVPDGNALEGDVSVFAGQWIRPTPLLTL